MKKQKIDKFKAELKTLLKKYSAEILWDCHECSDMHGIYDERMVVEIDGKRTIIASGCYIHHSDL